MLGNAQDDEEELVLFLVEKDREKIRKVYYGESDTWNFTITNLNCNPKDAEKAKFFLKIYLDGELLWNEYNDTDYRTWHLGIGETTTRSFRFPPWTEAKLHKVRIELYWLERSKPVAKRTKVVHVAKVFVRDWNPSAPTVLRETDKQSILTVSFRNGGNDYMYNTSITVIDTDGLQITPKLQNLGTIGTGKNKTTIFYVNASKTEERRQIYNPRFEIIYYDFRGEVHKEEYVATVKVITNPSVHNLMRTLGVFAMSVAIGAIALFLVLIKKHGTLSESSATTRAG